MLHSEWSVKYRLVRNEWRHCFSGFVDDAVRLYLMSIILTSSPQTSLCRPGQEYAAGSGSECWHYFYCLSETFCEVLKPRCVFHHQEETDPDKHNNSVWLTLFISTKCFLSCSFSHQVLKAFYCSRAAFKDNSHLPFLLQLWGDFI